MAGGDVGGDRLQHGRAVVGHAELVGHREQHRVGRAARPRRRRAPQRLRSGSPGERPAEPGLQRPPEQARPGRRGPWPPKYYTRSMSSVIGRMLRDTDTGRGLAAPAALRPGLAEQPDLLGLELVERDPRCPSDRSVEALQVSCPGPRPHWGGSRGCRNPPPDPVGPGRATGAGWARPPLTAGPAPGRSARRTRAADRGQEDLGLGPGAGRRRSGPRPAGSRTTRRRAARSRASPRLIPSCSPPRRWIRFGGCGFLGEVQRILVPPCQ